MRILFREIFSICALIGIGNYYAIVIVVDVMFCSVIVGLVVLPFCIARGTFHFHFIAPVFHNIIFTAMVVFMIHVIQVGGMFAASGAGFAMHVA